MTDVDPGGAVEFLDARPDVAADIDRRLNGYRYRDVVPADEVVDMLLDLRALAANQGVR